jgi:protochlorophyllide reductase
MDHTTILLTGATSGLGLAAARALAVRTDARLVVGARDPARADALRAAVPAERLAVLPLDLASLSSVRDFAAAVRRRLGPDGRLSAVACNAGVQLGAEDRTSADGYELTFASNHLGHFLLVHDLLDLLRPGAAVVSTASGTHDPDDRTARRFGFRGGIFPGAAAVARGALDPTASPAQRGRDRYATSKLCNVLSTYAMAARTPHLRFVAFDPGLMPGTGLARGLPAHLRFAWSNVLPVLARLMPGTSTPARSGAALARLLSDPAAADGTGVHVDHRLQRTPSSRDSRRTDWQDDLHAFSLAATALPAAA